jgi:hypothetical protein
MYRLQLKKKKEKLLVFFRRLGSLYNLSFTGQEVLHDKIIGLDGWRRKLLIVEENHNRYDSSIIDLYQVAACKVKKTYSAINAGDFEKNKVEEYLNAVALQFDFKNGNTPVVLSFYKNISNSVQDIKELATKTKQWEAVLSKMLPVG